MTLFAGGRSAPPHGTRSTSSNLPRLFHGTLVPIANRLRGIRRRVSTHPRERMCRVREIPRRHRAFIGTPRRGRRRNRRMRYRQTAGSSGLSFEDRLLNTCFDARHERVTTNDSEVANETGGSPSTRPRNVLPRVNSGRRRETGDWLLLNGSEGASRRGHDTSPAPCSRRHRSHRPAVSPPPQCRIPP